MLRIKRDDITMRSDGLLVRAKLKNYSDKLVLVFVPMVLDQQTICPVTALDALNKFYLDHNMKTTYLFSGLDGVLLPPATLTRLINELLIKVGIEQKFTAYSIKHSAISFLSENGISVEDIAAAARYKEADSVVAKHYAVLPAIKRVHALLAKAAVNFTSKPLEKGKEEGPKISSKVESPKKRSRETQTEKSPDRSEGVKKLRIQEAWKYSDEQIQECMDHLNSIEKDALEVQPKDNWIVDKIREVREGKKPVPKYTLRPSKKLSLKSSARNSSEVTKDTKPRWDSVK
jgi:hypothetical protein